MVIGKSFLAIQASFLPAYANASVVGESRIVFNIKGNDYRLVVYVNYLTQTVYVKFIGSHAEYDRVDVATVQLRNAHGN